MSERTKCKKYLEKKNRKFKLYFQAAVQNKRPCKARYDVRYSHWLYKKKRNHDPGCAVLSRKKVASP